jgi:hypothetical protein
VEYEIVAAADLREGDVIRVDGEEGWWSIDTIEPDLNPEVIFLRLDGPGS